MEKERKLQIIKAAVKRFDKHGPNKTTLDEIARDLRIGKATIYGYFNSKEELYFAALDWEGSIYLDEIKNIFNNEEVTVKERFLSYFELKESLPLKYKLIQDTLIQIIGENGFEKEQIFFKNILTGEEEIIKKAFTNLSTINNEGHNPILPNEIVLQSWGLFLGKKITMNINMQNEVDSKKMLMQLLSNYQ